MSLNTFYSISECLRESYFGEEFLSGYTSAAQGLLLALCYEIISDRLEGTSWSAKDQTLVSCVQDECPACYALTPTSFF